MYKQNENHKERKKKGKTYTLFKLKRIEGFQYIKHKNSLDKRGMCNSLCFITRYVHR